MQEEPLWFSFYTDFLAQRPTKMIRSQGPAPQAHSSRISCGAEAAGVETRLGERCPLWDGREGVLGSLVVGGKSAEPVVDIVSIVKSSQLVAKCRQILVQAAKLGEMERRLSVGARPSRQSSWAHTSRAAASMTAWCYHTITVAAPLRAFVRAREQQIAALHCRKYSGVPRKIGRGVANFPSNQLATKTPLPNRRPF